MSHNRQAIADEILKAIEYGHLPTDEIERRLQRIKDDELSGSVYDEYNKTKVDICTSLLCHLYTDGQIFLDDRSDDIEQRITDRQNSYIRHKKALTRGIISAAAVLVLFIGLVVVNVISPIQWFSSKSINDEQQYVITGHSISIDTISKAIAEHSESGNIALTTTKYIDLVEFLGFDPNIPSVIVDNIPATRYHALVMSPLIMLSCYYGDDTSIAFRVSLFEDVELAYMQFEQDKEGEIVPISGNDVYRYSNVSDVNYLWIEGNAIYSLSVNESIHVDNDAISDLFDRR